MNIGLSFDPEVDRQRAIAYSNDFYEFRQRLDYTALSNLCEEMVEALDEKVNQYSDFKIQVEKYILDTCMTFDRNNPQQLFQLANLFGMTNFSQRFYSEVLTNTNGIEFSSATVNGVNVDSDFNQFHLCCPAYTYGRWPKEDGKYIIRYNFKGSFPSGYKAKIRSIMAEWEDGTDLNFYEITSRVNFCRETRPKVEILIDSSVSSIGGRATLGAIGGSIFNADSDCNENYGKLRLGNGFGNITHSGATIPYYSGNGVNQEKTVQVTEVHDNPDNAYNHFFYSSNIIPVYDGCRIRPVVQSDGTVSILQMEYDEVQYTPAYIHWTGQTLEYAQQVQASKSNEGYATSPIYELPDGWITNTYNKTIDSRFSQVVRHELGHTIGLLHEHQRSDRSDWIFIHSDHNDSQITLSTYEEVNIGSYDLSSVMHYNSLINPGNFTLECANPSINCPIEQIWDHNGNIGWGNISNKVTPNHFISPGDKSGVNHLYPHY